MLALTAVVMAAPVAAQPAPDDEAGATVEGRSVLLVEDHPVNRKLARNVLASRGYRVVEALDTDAEILAVSCPTCAVVLEDAVKSNNMDERIQVKEISEIVNARLNGHYPTGE